MERVGEILLERGLVSPKDLADARTAQASGEGLLDSTLVRLGAVAEEDLLSVLSEHFAVPVIKEGDLPSVGEVRATIDRLRIARSWLVNKEAIAWFVSEGETEHLCVASRHIYDPAVQEAAEHWCAAAPKFFLVASDALKPLFAELGAQVSELQHTPHEQIADLSRLRELAEETPVIDFVNAMVAEAIARRASDVHVEPFEEKLVIRLRVDGVLTPWRTAPRGLFDAVSSRIKLLSGMDIAERRLPQDGRQSLRISGREIDVRVSALPTTWGESIVLRFLGKTTTLPDLAALGVGEDQRNRLSQIMARQSGMLLVTGPTGSGKTTTIYRLVMNLNDGVRKIVTVEDPVEIDLPGVMQMQARPDIGLGFARGLRSILRQDPDVIMVGEIRDRETAAIAVQAALTGHLVVSTVHTNSALAAVSRLLDLGVEEYFIADVIRGLVGQRLMRRVCSHCSLPSADNAEERFARAHLSPDALQARPNWREAVGCTHCNHTGYAGRIGVFEIIEANDALHEAMRQRSAETELEAIARKLGFRSLNDDALVKARAGETTLREVVRVLGLSSSP